MQIGLDHWDGDTGFLGHVASRKEGDPVVEPVGEWMATPLNFAVAGRRPRIAAPCRIFLANNEKEVPPWNAGPGNMAELLGMVALGLGAVVNSRLFSSLLN